jgi:hypothetical protein
VVEVAQPEVSREARAAWYMRTAAGAPAPARRRLRRDQPGDALAQGVKHG